MPDLKDFLPDARFSRADQRATALAAEVSARGERVGLWRAAGDAINSEWASSWAIRQFARSGFEFDPNFALNDETVKTLGEGLDTDLWESFSPAVSLGHAQRIREQLIDVQASRQRLAEMGVGGTALRIGAEIFDPAFIAASIGVGAISGGVGTAGAAATRVGRIQRLVRGGVIAAGSEVPIQAYIASQDPEQGAGTVLWSAAGAFLLGGAASAVGPELAAAARRFRKDIEFGDTLAAMGAASRHELTPDVMKMLDDKIDAKDGRLYFKDQLAAADKRKAVEEIISRSGLDPVFDADEIQTLRELSPQAALNQFGFARAADELPGPRGDEAVDEIVANDIAPEPTPGDAPADGPPTPPSLPPKQTGDFDLSGLNAAKARYGPVRFSMTGKLGTSEVPIVRKVANALAQDALPKQGDEVNVQAASEWVRIQHSTRMARLYRGMLPEFRAWAKANNIPATQMNAARQRFMQEVGKAIRFPKGTFADPHINAVADAMRAHQRALLDLAQRHRVKGFATVKPNDNYLMRIWRLPVIDKAVAAFGEQPVVDMFAEAIRRGSDDIDAEDAAKIGKAFLRAVRRHDEYSALDKSRFFSMDNADLLAKVLRENVDDITDEQVENILYTVQPRDRDANVPTRARRRMRLDETYTHVLPDGSTLRVDDLFENDAEAIMNVYTRQMIGASAISEVHRAVQTGPDDVIENFGQIRTRVIREAAALGESARDIQRDLDKLETLYKSIVGLRLNPDTKFNSFLRTMRGFNYVNLAGQFGLAQVPEIGNLVGSAGVRVMIQQTPALRQVFSRARAGRLTNELLEEMEVSLGVGTDRLTHQVVSRFDETTAIAEFGGGSVERLLERGARFSNDVSFMAPVNMMLQRMAGAAAAQKFTNLAFSGKPLSAARLSSLGISQADADAIFAQIRKHATTEEGMFGRNLRRVNIDRWDDQQAASKMVVALDRWSRNVIQDNDPGNMALWMTKEWGKTLLQFRTFVAVAWEKQFLHRVAVRDFDAFAGAMTASFVASIGYVGQTYINSIGRPDAEEFRSERLSPGAIARTAFQRGGYSSLLPGAIDTVDYLTGGSGSSFQFGRSTQLDSDFLFGNPTTALVRSGGRAAAGVGRAVRGTDQFDQGDARAVLNLLPFRNVVGVKNVLDAIGGQFPEPE